MIGKKVKARRLALNMTQDELAQKLGYKSRSTINKIELDINDVSQSKLVKLAEALECDPLELIEITPPREFLSDAVTAYAAKLCKLNKTNFDSAVTYIDYLLKTQEKE